MRTLIEEEILRVKELMNINIIKETKDTEIEEDIMSGVQSGYPDASWETKPGYDFTSKGALGSQPELEDEGFTEPQSNYSKIRKGYDFASDGPEDSYMDPSGRFIRYGINLRTRRTR